MIEVALSPKYQLLIPMAIRRQLALRIRQKIWLVVKDGLIIMVPERPLNELRGYLKVMDVRFHRNHSQ